jgi:hypothetical protein
MGRAVDAESGQPIAGAVVMAFRVTPTPESNSRSGNSQGLPVLTSPEGYFLFRDLQAGDYLVRGIADGYLPANGANLRRPDGLAQTISLDGNDRVRDVSLRMWRAGAIEGRLVDEAGEPIEGALAELFALDETAGAPRVTIRSTAKTDDRGAYRFAELVGGEYFACAFFARRTVPSSIAAAVAASQSELPLYSMSGAPPTVSGYRVGDSVLFAMPGQRVIDPAPGPDGRMLVYADACQGGAPAPDQATPISLLPGQTLSGIDLAVRLIPAARVTGIVLAPDGPAAGLMVQLFPQAQRASFETGRSSATAFTDPAGRFTLIGVPPGAYRARVLSSSERSHQAMFDSSGRRLAPPPGTPVPVEALWASMPLIVGDGDLTGRSIALRRGMTVSGRVAFDGTTPRPDPSEWSRIGLALEAATGNEPQLSTGSAPVDRPGEFESTPQAPGRYRMRMTSAPAGGWSLKSIVLNGRDISDEPFDLDGDLSGVVVTLTDRPSVIGGVVHDAAGAADVNAAIVAFPADRSRFAQTGQPARRMAIERATSSGRYTLAGLPAGEYVVAALDDAAARRWRDPKMLEQLARTGARVTIRDGETRALDLQTGAIR